ncbi:MAG: hypothetical protein L0H53_16655, partial [Candidatus Nitrosocosmicus sp.]|nr:hypothetical protein [Candidatus Nitrosocosmicus sp.]
ALLRYLEIFRDTTWIEMQEPVYVYKDDSGSESVYYNSRLMKNGQLYEIEWEGAKWALRKTDKEVEFLKWDSNHKSD